MDTGWNLWVWLDCIGVVSGWYCKEVYPHNIYYFSHSTCISSFFGSSILPLCSFLNVFFILVIFVQCSKRC